MINAMGTPACTFKQLWDNVGCRGRLQQPGLAVDGNYYLNNDILLYPTGAGIQSAQSTVQLPETAAPRCCPRLTDVIVTRGTDF